MNYKITKVNVSIDHITMTSKDLRKSGFNGPEIPNYKLLGLRPTSKKGKKLPEREASLYKYFYEYKHTLTGNKLHIYAHRYNNYYPNLSVKFFPSWEHLLTYQEVVKALNFLISEYNFPFSLAEFHVAIDLFSEHYYLHDLAHCTKSRRTIDSSNKDYPTTYNWQNYNSEFTLVLYDKKKHLLDKKIDELSKRTISYLKTVNITRLECIFSNTVMRLVPSLSDLATMSFAFIYPKFIKFLRPNVPRLTDRELRYKRFDFELTSFRQWLRKKGIKHNHFYYLEDNSQLSEPVRKALSRFVWCKSPEEYPIVQPKLIIRPQPIKFIKH